MSQGRDRKRRARYPVSVATKTNKCSNPPPDKQQELRDFFQKANSVGLRYKLRLEDQDFLDSSQEVFSRCNLSDDVITKMLRGLYDLLP
jgi:hypothetical protein